MQAVAKVVLDWAGLDEEEAEAPGYQTVLVPDRLGAELLGLTPGGWTGTGGEIGVGRAGHEG